MSIECPVSMKTPWPGIEDPSTAADSTTLRRRSHHHTGAVPPLRAPSNLLPHRDRNANVDGGGHRLARLHARKEAPSLERVEQRAIQVRIVGGLEELHLRRAVSGDAEAGDRDDLDALAPERGRELGQRF